MTTPILARSRPFLPLLAALVLALPAGGAAAPVEPGTGMPPRADAVALRLAPAAARAARPLSDAPPSAAAARAAATAPAGTRFGALGLPALDRAVAALDGAWLEREFPGETPPPPGSPDTDFTAFWLLQFTGGDAATVVASLRALAEVEDAWTIARVPAQAVPDDSMWTAATHLYQPSRHDIHAPEAWDVTKGDSGIVIAIVDTGVLWDHPDLAGHIWTNPVERDGTPGVDDDGNGFVDDAHGWDFVALRSADEVVPYEDALDQDPDPNDFVGHGTAVAGVAGAVTDNRIGVAGVAWQSRLMPLRIGWSAATNPSGELDLSYAAQAIRYATRMGANVINCSFETRTQLDLSAAVAAATRAGIVVVFAAGNFESPHFIQQRDDVLAVAATDEHDVLTSFTNLGDYVDLAAPGWNIATTSLYRPGADSTGKRQPSYTRFASGTSFSAPVVSGTAALVQARQRADGHPPLTPFEMILRLTETADDISSENPGRTGYGTGRVNAARAVMGGAGSIQLEARAEIAGPGVTVTASSGGVRVVVVTRSGRFLVLDPVRGTTERDIPLAAGARTGLAAADLGDGYGLGFFFVGTDGRIHGLTSAGVPLPGWPLQVADPGTETVRMPALGDLDGDGVPEVVWGGDRTYAWRRDGTPLPGFPVGAFSGPFALAQLDGRPGLEIVLAEDNPLNIGPFRVWNGAGQPVAGWSNAVWEPGVDLVVASGAAGTQVVACGSSYMAAIGADGVLNWRRSLQPTYVGGLALGDVNGDYVDEVLFARGLELYALDLATGATMPGWPIRLSGAVAGPPVSGSAGPDGNGVFVPVAGTGLLAFDGARHPLSGFPKPGRAGANAELSDFDRDGRTEILCTGGLDSMMFVYDVGPGSWTGTPSPWPTARGNAARTGCVAGAPGLTVLDDAGPPAISDLDALAGPRSSAFAWTAPADESGDHRVRRYEMRYGPAPLDESNFADGDPVALPPPAAPGAFETARVDHLPEGATYWFALRSFDAAGNPSPLSPSVRVTTPRVAPAPITTLDVVAGNDTSVVLRWHPTGDDGLQGFAARYHVHAAAAPLDAASFDDAPIRVVTEPAASTNDAWIRVGGLTPATRYWFAVEAEDAVGNRSRISNVVTAWPGPLAARRGMAVAPAAQPARPPVEIRWQAPGVPAGVPHRVAIYDINGRLRREMTTDAGTEGTLRWDGGDDHGHRLPAGVYFVRFTAAGRTVNGRLVLLQ